VIRRVWNHRDLVVSLVRIQYKLRYRQSVAGLAWAVLPPLATLGVATIVFHQVVGVGSGRVPYAVFTMAALVPWTFFANSMNQGVNAVAGALPMVTRLPFPRAALTLSIVGLSLLDFAVSGALYLAFAFATGTGLPATAAWVPALILIEVMLTTGIALWASAINVFARDLRLAVPIAMQLWLFVTPVMYPLSGVPPNLRLLYRLNPMTGVVDSFRRVLVYSQSPDLGLMVPTVIGAAVVLVAGWWYFATTEFRFADVV
jgi:homopolymeric O-antigen transport system permease protein